MKHENRFLWLGVLALMVLGAFNLFAQYATVTGAPTNSVTAAVKTADGVPLPAPVANLFVKVGGILAIVMWLTRFVVRFMPANVSVWMTFISDLIKFIGMHSSDGPAPAMPAAPPPTPPQQNFDGSPGVGMGATDIKLVVVAIGLGFALLMPAGARAQTNMPAASTLTFQQMAQQMIDEAQRGTNKTWDVIVFGDYDSKIARRWGGGIALLHPIAALNQYVEVGPRLDWINGGFEAVSVNVTEKISVNPITRLRHLWFTPYVEQSVAYPISGKTIGGVSVPGKNFNSEPVVVAGGGGSLVYEWGNWSAGLMAGYEKWFGLPGQVLIGGPVVQGRW